MIQHRSARPGSGRPGSGRPCAGRLSRFAAPALLLLLGACAAGPRPEPHAPRTSSLTQSQYWNSATVYFLLTDRFHNGNPANDRAVGRTQEGGGVLRTWMGGDLEGVRRRIEDGWFDSLGVTAIWLTPWVENIHGSTDEGYGRGWGFHGYWTRDWTAVDPSLGTMDDLRAMVDAAHRHGIRVLMDAVVNHTGPPTSTDPAWPADWVRSQPNCTYRSYQTTITCNLVATLPDILTESDAPVELPGHLVEKWRREGRLEREQAELDEFFRRTGYPRAPRFYVIKWLTDWVRDLGIDGYRVDTAKHIEETVSAELRAQADHAFAEWKRANPASVMDDRPFYMVGEVYGFGVGGGRSYDFGDRRVDFFAFGYDALINFGFKAQARGAMDSLFTQYAAQLRGPLANAAVLNYVSSHDDGEPFDQERARALEAGTRLLLAPGGAQIYYGDETARPLRVDGARGDAHLRSFMNWADLAPGSATARVLDHWRRLGRFRRAHPAVGAGEHQQLQAAPYVFSRTLAAGELNDRVVVGLGMSGTAKTVPVGGIFAEGAAVRDAYSGARATVSGGAVSLLSPYDVVLLEEAAAGGADAVLQPRDTAAVQVVVQNNSQHDLEILVSSGGATYRMGMVPATRNATFTLRRAVFTTGRIALSAQAMGGSPRPTGTIPPPRLNPIEVTVSPGSIVDYEITTLLVNSTATVRP